ncbi:unnamed protein product [Lactuca saligna]|uniref:Uncharacterized protein n=1 Tax=Lactuca saligna TaxID=75948 RepID=A0AA35YLP0_LACSI|nr:unnamed protein product [Lactuca saligna]
MVAGDESCGANEVVGGAVAVYFGGVKGSRMNTKVTQLGGGNLVSWSAKKQPPVSRSCCESEYQAMVNTASETASEIVWITHLLRELHALASTVPTLLCDNKSSLFLSQNPIAHKRAKHIDIDYHLVRRFVASGKLKTKHAPTHLQLADIFTKSLPRPLFDQFRSKLRVGPPPISLTGARLIQLDHNRRYLWLYRTRACLYDGGNREMSTLPADYLVLANVGDSRIPLPSPQVEKQITPSRPFFPSIIESLKELRLPGPSAPHYDSDRREPLYRQPTLFTGDPPSLPATIEFIEGNSNHNNISMKLSNLRLYMRFS